MRSAREAARRDAGPTARRLHRRARRQRTAQRPSACRCDRLRLRCRQKSSRKGRCSPTAVGSFAGFADRRTICPGRRASLRASAVPATTTDLQTASPFLIRFMPPAATGTSSGAREAASMARQSECVPLQLPGACRGFSPDRSAGRNGPLSTPLRPSKSTPDLDEFVFRPPTDATRIASATLLKVSNNLADDRIGGRAVALRTSEA